MRSACRRIRGDLGGRRADRAADEQLPAIAELGHTKLYAARPMKHKAIEDAPKALDGANREGCPAA